MVTLAFVGVILFFVLLDLLVMRKLERRGPFTGAGEEGRPAGQLEVVMPRGFFFHPGHVWVRIQEDGSVRVGVDDFVRTALGAVDRVRLPDPGTRLEEGAEAFEIGAGEVALKLVSPMTGEVGRANPRLAERPELLVEDPYGAGWLIAFEPESGPCRELASLVIARAAAEWMRSELATLGGFLAERGQRVASASWRGLLAGASPDVVRAFEERFTLKSTERREVSA